MAEKDYSGDIAALKEQIKALQDSDKKQEDMIHAVHLLAREVGEMSVNVKNMQEEMKRMRVDVDALKVKPSKRWEGATSAVISAMVSGLVAFVFVRVGLQ